jgi:3-oxoacyl-[acyl-carrier protein] reductase
MASSDSSLSLAGKIALVTGASRGIGTAIAQRLAKDGASVIVHYAASKEKAEQVVEDIRKNGGKAEALGADLSSPNGPSLLISQLDATFGGSFVGRLDILVNNSGTARFGTLMDAKEEDFDYLFNLNVRSVFLLSQEAARRSVPHGWGRIINIGSGLGEGVPIPGVSLYSSTKFAVNGLTRGWSRDLGTTGVTVNNVEPGPITTDLNPVDGPYAETLTKLASLKRFGTTEELANVVAFIASPASSYVHGANILVDGGATA